LHRLRTERCQTRRAAKNASTDTGLSDVGISYDQSSRRQKLAAVPEEIFERQVQDKIHMPTTAGLIRAAAERGHAGASDHIAPALAQLCAAKSPRVGYPRGEEMPECSSGWGRKFDEPIALPGGGRLIPHPRRDLDALQRDG
jgi:hypothetical protein